MFPLHNMEGWTNEKYNTAWRQERKKPKTNAILVPHYRIRLYYLSLICSHEQIKTFESKIQGWSTRCHFLLKQMWAKHPSWFASRVNVLIHLSGASSHKINLVHLERLGLLISDIILLRDYHYTICPNMYGLYIYERTQHSIKKYMNSHEFMYH